MNFIIRKQKLEKFKTSIYSQRYKNTIKRQQLEKIVDIFKKRLKSIIYKEHP